MFALEIINALNDPDNPAKPKGRNAKLKNLVKASVDTGENECVDTAVLEYPRETSAALDRREEWPIERFWRLMARKSHRLRY